jgi:hypothetical protein
MKPCSYRSSTSSTRYTGLVADGKEKFQADPLVIALAKVNGYTVITEESAGSLGKSPASVTR